MNKKEKIIIYFLTFFIDVYLLYVVFNLKLNNFDEYFSVSILLLHIIFYFSIYNNQKYGIDFCHYALALSFILSVFLKNKNIIFLCLLILLAIQFLWKYFNKCILNNNEQTFFGPYMPTMVFTTKIITTILFLKFSLHS